MQVNNEIESLRYRDEDDFISYVVYGKTSIWDNVRRLREGVDILVATPGRLNDLVEKGAVKLDSIEVICLDEADEILKQGFKEEIEKVFSEMRKVNKRKVQVLLFSATIPPWLKGLSEDYQTSDRPYINLISDD
jgi:ATP-dependent RNA helicase DDX21